MNFFLNVDNKMLSKFPYEIMSPDADGFSLGISGARLIRWYADIQVGQADDNKCDGTEVGFAQHLVGFKATVSWTNKVSIIYYVNCLDQGPPLRDVAEGETDPIPFYTRNTIAFHNVTKCGEKFQIQFDDTPSLNIRWLDPLMNTGDLESISWDMDADLFLVQRRRGSKVKIISSGHWRLNLNSMFQAAKTLPVGKRTILNGMPKLTWSDTVAFADPKVDGKAAKLEVTAPFRTLAAAQAFKGSCHK
jgi:hypothetical protein